MPRGAAQPRTRLAADERRRQLTLSAEQELLRQGHMPVPPEEVARAAGVSKALIYTYFPTQHDLFNASLEQRLEQLGDFGRVAGRKSMADAAAAVADVYLRQVAEAGPVIHFILRDGFMAGAVSPRARLLQGRLVRPLVRRLQRDLGLSAAEAVAAFNLMATIPEELGAHAHRKDLPLEKAQELCAALIGAAVSGLKGLRA